MGPDGNQTVTGPGPCPLGMRFCYPCLVCTDDPEIIFGPMGQELF